MADNGVQPPDDLPRSGERPALAVDERLLRLILEALPVGVQVMGVEGDIFLSNPAAVRIWGRIVDPAQERYAAVRARWSENGAQIAPQEWASVKALRHGQTTADQRLDIEAFDGQVRTILNSGAPIRDENHNILGAVVVNEDITERVQLERQFFQAQKMEAAGRLASSTAHDLNNVVSIIQGFGDLLKDELVGQPEKIELVEEILSATRRAASLSKGLLAFARRSDLRPCRADLNAVLVENADRLRLLTGKTISLRVELDSSECPVVLDIDTLEHSLLNLVANARDAMPDGGHLLLTTSNREPDFVTLSVRDTGHGMNEQVRSRLFEPFFTTKPKHQGTGLGLAAVHGFVTQSGGRIEVDSAPERGTTFHLLFPRAAGEATG